MTKDTLKLKKISTVANMAARKTLISALFQVSAAIASVKKIEILISAEQHAVKTQTKYER